jgi:hypothetical protein
MGWTPIQLTEDVGQQMRENAFASVGAVAGEDDLVVGVRLGHRLNEFEGQLGSSVVVGIGLGGFAATAGSPWGLPPRAPTDPDLRNKKLILSHLLDPPRKCL